ncbi:Lar family restriction alleviation protein [Rhizobium leguminosarum]|uniref:Lar family restriction alleviation protein n=1 Tax=Rhizobium leguminosarum TaxID=384 RepID=UPI0039907510
MKELEACPFCGSGGEYLYRHVALSKWRHRFVCASTTCGMEGPVEATKADAEQAWNRRFPPMLDVAGCREALARTSSTASAEVHAAIRARA